MDLNFNVYILYSLIQGAEVRRQTNKAVQQTDLSAVDSEQVDLKTFTLVKFECLKTFSIYRAVHS